MTRIGTVIDGKYEILKEIGRGGMSIVYLAMDKHLNKQWAVKEIRKKGSGKNDEIVVNSLLAEANLMKRLDHPALPRIVDIIDNGVTIYVVMDYIEGESLDKILEAEGVQPEEKVIVWAKQIADALAYLHAQKPPIIYRDMKPANVMLKPEGNIKIIDFGIAREYKEQNLADTTVLGTRGYAPPEQYSGQTDARSDIFALGMTMHQLLTGVDPRNGEAYAPVRQWNPELSEGIEIIIDKCVQPAAEKRYQTCADLMYDLEHPELITKDFKRRQKRRLGAFIAAAALTVTGFIGGFLCERMAVAENNSTYEALVSVMSATSLEEKIDSYEQAIRIYPENPEAYLRILEAYEDANSFGKQENKQFVAVFNANKQKFDMSSPEVAELYYQAGMMYFNYYTGEDSADGDLAFSARVQRAHQYFEGIVKNEQLSPDFENQTRAECYYAICNFYKEFVLKDLEAASRSDFENLFDTINGVISRMESSGANTYDRLSLYNGVFMLLYDQHDELVYVDYPMEDVLDLFDTVYNRAKELDSPKSAIRRLRDEMMKHYDDYRADIVQSYDNAAERSE